MRPRFYTLRDPRRPDVVVSMRWGAREAYAEFLRRPGLRIHDEHNEDVTEAIRELVYEPDPEEILGPGE